MFIVDTIDCNTYLKRNPMKKKRIYTTLIVLIALFGKAMGQALNVLPIEVESGKQTEMVIEVEGLSTMTALQFNLFLPQGVSLDETNITKGEAVDGHKLMLRPLPGGGRMFVFYNMNKALIDDGELVRTVSSKSSLSVVRTANTAAKSYLFDDVPFTITVTDNNQLRGDVNDDGVVNGTDIQAIINLIIKSLYDEKADVNEDDIVNGTDIQEVINIILKVE